MISVCNQISGQRHALRRCHKQTRCRRNRWTEWNVECEISNRTSC